jgi:hypothetical protein
MQNSLAELEHVIYLNKWIERVAEPLPDLGGYATCPFAKQAQKNQILIEKINVEGIVPPTDLNFEIVIYVIEDNIDSTTLDMYVEKFNSTFKDLVFLADHPNQIIETGTNAYSSNGKYVLILCQPKDKLRKARETLTKTRYYSFWNPEYLKKIMGDDYGLLD